MSAASHGEHVSSTPPSVKAGFLHDTQELLLVHLTVSIPVGLVNHLLHKRRRRYLAGSVQRREELNHACGFAPAYLQLVVCEVLPQLFGHPLQVLKGDLACLIVIEQAESLQDFFFGVLLSLK